MKPRGNFARDGRGIKFWSEGGTRLGFGWLGLLGIILCEKFAADAFGFRGRRVCGSSAASYRFALGLMHDKVHIR